MFAQTLVGPNETVADLGNVVEYSSTVEAALMRQLQAKSTTFMETVVCSL